MKEQTALETLVKLWGDRQPMFDAEDLYLFGRALLERAEQPCKDMIAQLKSGAHRGKLNQIDQHTVDVLEAVAARIRALYEGK